MLLSRIEGGGSGVKRVPSYVAPDLAADIRRHVSATLRQRKGSFPCYFVTEITTFALPAGMFIQPSIGTRKDDVLILTLDSVPSPFVLTALRF